VVLDPDLARAQAVATAGWQQPLLGNCQRARPDNDRAGNRWLTKGQANSM